MDLIPQGGMPQQQQTVPQPGAMPTGANAMPDPTAAPTGDNGLATGSSADMQAAAGIMPMGSDVATNPTPDDGGDSGDGTVKASPEEQHQYNQMVTKAKQFIHGKQSRDAVLKMLNLPGKPAYENIGRAAANIVQMIEKSAESSGMQLSQDVMVHGGMAIVQDLLNTAKTAGVLGKVDESQLPHLFQLSVLEAVKQYGQSMIAAGNAPTNDAKNFMAHMVTQEAQSGKAPAALTQNLVAHGVKQALGAASPAGA
jgi:hypothetical protein